MRAAFRFVGSLDELVAAHPDEDVWAIGGASVYAETIAEADQLSLSEVVGDLGCTKFFAPYQPEVRLAAQGDDCQEGGITYRFETWQLLEPRPTNSGSAYRGIEKVPPTW